MLKEKTKNLTRVCCFFSLSFFLSFFFSFLLFLFSLFSSLLFSSLLFSSLLFSFLTQLKQYIEWFNTVSQWVATQVVVGTTVKKQASSWKKFIKVARHLLSLNNFNSLMQIMSGLRFIFCVFVFLCFCVFVFLCFCVFVFLCFFCVFVFCCEFLNDSSKYSTFCFVLL